MQRMATAVHLLEKGTHVQTCVFYGWVLLRFNTTQDAAALRENVTRFVSGAWALVD